MPIYIDYNTTLEEESLRSQNHNITKKHNPSSWVRPVKLEKKNEILNKLKTIESFDEGWDGYGALVPSLNVFENTKKFINSLDEYYIEKLNIEGFYASPYGTFFIEWIKGNKMVSVEIGHDLFGYYSQNLISEISEDGISFKEIPKELYNSLKEMYPVFVFEL